VAVSTLVSNSEGTTKIVTCAWSASATTIIDPNHFDDSFIRGCFGVSPLKDVSCWVEGIRGRLDARCISRGWRDYNLPVRSYISISKLLDWESVRAGIVKVE